MTNNIFWPRKTRWRYMCVLMNVRVCEEDWCICNIWWRHSNVWLTGGMASKSAYVDFKCKAIPWIYPLKSKPIPVQFTPNISWCVYVYIFISWTQEDAPWLVRKGKVWGVPCDFIICRKKYFSLRIVWSLKRECRRFDEVFVTGCTGACPNVNFQCGRRWEFHRNGVVSV